MERAETADTIELSRRRSGTLVGAARPGEVARDLRCRLVDPTLPPAAEA